MSALDVRVGPTGGSIDLKAPKARVQGGLYVGTLVGQTGSFNLGDIWATGRISAATGMVALEAGGVRVYAATGSDAGTRGVSFRQNVTGGDVQSGYAGARSSLSESALVSGRRWAPRDRMRLCILRRRVGGRTCASLRVVCPSWLRVTQVGRRSPRKWRWLAGRTARA